jgi:hypothetical protein
MFTLTVVRINKDTKAFENTELHSVINLYDLVNEIISKSEECSYDEISKISNINDMEIRQSITLQFENEEKIWFYYITRLS